MLNVMLVGSASANFAMDEDPKIHSPIAKRCKNCIVVVPIELLANPLAQRDRPTDSLLLIPFEIIQQWIGFY